MLKILCLRRLLKIDVTDEFTRAIEYHRVHGAYFMVEYRDIYFSRDQILPFMLGTHGYAAVIYCYERLDEPYNYVPYTQQYDLDTSIVNLPVGKLEEDLKDGWLWTSTAHELMHVLGKRLAYKYGIINKVDVTMDTYLDELDPYSKTGNFAQSWDILQPYMPILFPKVNRVTIIRSNGLEETIGTLTAFCGDATFTCRTMELPWKDNQRNISCIPIGTYEVKRTFWISKMKWVYEVTHVKNRSGIYIHEGNFVTDYEGCIGLGDGIGYINKDKLLDITNTRKTVSAFEGFMNKELFTLTIE